VIPQAPLASRGGGSAATADRPQAKTVAVVDLNSAALDQLQTLPGITREYATRIVAGRPYQALGDVVTRARIPAPIVDQLSPPAIVRSVGRAPSAALPPVGPGPAR
jgi:DNA uptake protein ComE-like DNA-binding protein